MEEQQAMTIKLQDILKLSQQEWSKICLQGLKYRIELEIKRLAELVGKCDKCPAAGERQGETYCCYEAWFLGESAKLQTTATRKADCPLSDALDDYLTRTYEFERMGIQFQRSIPSTKSIVPTKGNYN